MEIHYPATKQERALGSYYQYYILIIIESYNFSKFFCSKYRGQIWFHLVFFIMTELNGIFKPNFSKNGKQQIL